MKEKIFRQILKSLKSFFIRYFSEDEDPKAALSTKENNKLLEKKQKEQQNLMKQKKERIVNFKDKLLSKMGQDTFSELYKFVSTHRDKGTSDEIVCLKDTKTCSVEIWKKQLDFLLRCRSIDFYGT